MKELDGDILFKMTPRPLCFGDGGVRWQLFPDPGARAWRPSSGRAPLGAKKFINLEVLARSTCISRG
jgi:hypothetical protein